MAVRCSKCGEELLGPVNRCWKCGQKFATLPDAGGVPPVRSEPAPVPAATAASAQVVRAAHPLDTPIAAQHDAATGLRTGSPFAAGAVMTPIATVAATSVTAARPIRGRTPVPATDALIRDHVAVAGAIGSIVLGLFSLSVSWMYNPTAVIGGALLALLGLAMGMWGLYSRRRGWALFGMLVCVAAISLASYKGARLLYDARQEAKELEGQFGISAVMGRTSRCES